MTELMTREQAIRRLVDLDCARWGECERAAAQRLRGALSHGLALNALAHYDVENIDHKMAKLAQSVMTTQDHRDLRQGG